MTTIRLTEAERRKLAELVEAECAHTPNAARRRTWAKLHDKLTKEG